MKRGDLFFSRFAQFAFGRPLIVLLLMGGMIGFLSSRIPKIVLDTTPEALLSHDDPSLLKYYQFQEQFGRAEPIMIMVEAPKIFSRNVLVTLKRLHQDIEQHVPFVRSVTSLVNIRTIEGENDVLTVKGFLDGWPASGERVSALEARAKTSRLYKNYILSGKKEATALIIETEAFIHPGEDRRIDAPAPHYFSAEENTAVVSAVKAIAARYNAPGFKVTVSGGPVIEKAFNDATLADIKRCIVLSLAVVALFLILLFRNIIGVVLPMVIVISSLLSTLGLMALFHVPIKITTIVIPAFLLSVSVADAVHILSIFFKRYEATGDKKEALVYSFGYAGMAITMTSLTTVAGLLSFSVVKLSAIAEVGYLSAAGVILAFLYTVCLLPAMMAVVPVKAPRKRNQVGGEFEPFLCAVAAFTCKHPRAILSAAIIVFMVPLPFLRHIQFSHNIIQFFPNDSIQKKRLLSIDRVMEGTLTLDLVLDTGKENGICDPDLLNRIETFSTELEATRMNGVCVGKVISINDVIKEIHQALHNGKTDAYKIPQDHDAIAQELLLFESSGGTDLEKLVDEQMSETRMIIKTKWVDAVVCQRFIRQIESLFQRIFPSKVKLTVTGLMSILSRAITAAIYSMANSYVLAFVVVTGMMILLLKRFSLGTLSMVPNLFPIVIIMGAMGILEIPFDLNALMVGGVAIGVLVDDTVHFMYNFQRFYNETGDATGAIRDTFLGAGKAMLITSLVLSSGFFILVFGATLKHVAMFGILTGSSILLALVFDFLMTPAVCLLLSADKKKSSLRSLKHTEITRTGLP
jgi:hypothetical protein